MIARHSIAYGMQVGLGTFAVTGAAVALANRLLPKFRGALGISGKVALAITPPLFVGPLRAEQTMTTLQRRFHQRGELPTDMPHETLDEVAAAQGRKGKLVAVVPLLGAAACAGVFVAQWKGFSTGKTAFSVRMLHSRVYAQAAVVTTLACTMMWVAPPSAWRQQGR